MEIKNAQFLTTVASSKDILKTAQNEFAFVGRSNVGKSSLINALANNSKLAKTSSTPGKTKFINYFSINKGEFHIVDLPGYGYHKASKQAEQKWTKLIEDYFYDSPNLKCVFVLVDIRHDVSELDKMMINFLVYNRINFIIVLTKADKLSKAEQFRQIDAISKQIAIPKANLVVVSSDKKMGLDTLTKKIEDYLN